MQRYFVLDSEYWTTSTVTIQGEDVHHMSRVMRNEVGDSIICINQDGKVARCEIAEITNEKVIANINDWIEENNELPVDVTIAQGLPKGDKLELVLQKGTELGAGCFIPFKTERSIVQWDKKKTTKKLQRFNKIVKEASEQSARNRIPDVLEPLTIKELIEKGKEFDMQIIAYEEEAKTKNHHSFADVLKDVKPGMRILICIGPEGGFSLNEVNVLKENNFIAVRLGKRILRTETAALYALASISYHFEEM